MKKPLLFLVLFFILFRALGQEVIKINYQEMNLSSKKSKLLNPVPYGSFYSFQIEDVNKFLFKVTIEGENIKLDTPVPTELQALFRLSKQELDNKVKEEETQTKLDVEKVEEETLNFKSALNSIRNNVNLEVEILKNDFHKMEKKMDQDPKYKLKKIADKEMLMQKIQLQNELKNQTEDLLSDMDKFLEDLNKFLVEVSYINVQKINLINLASRDVSFETMKNDIYNDNLLRPKDPLSNFKKLEQLIKSLKIKLDDIKSELDKDKTNEVDKKYKLIVNAFKNVNQEEILTSYSQVLYLYNELQNENNFIAKAPPVQANGDFINYEITIIPTQTHEYGAYKNPVKFDFDIPVRGGLKVDFSVGPIFAFGDGALDEKFYFQQTESENRGILKERNNNNILNPGIAAMMHFYKRSGENLSWGGLFGVGAGFQTIEDVNLSFYSGISFVLGKEQKIMLNTGIAFMNVDRLKSGEFNVDSEYDTSNVSINNITEKVFKSSFFLSLSYSLASRNKN